MRSSKTNVDERSGLCDRATGRERYRLRADDLLGEPASKARLHAGESGLAFGRSRYRPCGRDLHRTGGTNINDAETPEGAALALMREIIRRNPDAKRTNLSPRIYLFQFHAECLTVTNAGS